MDCQPQSWLRVASHGLWHHAVSVDDVAAVCSDKPCTAEWKWVWTKSPKPQKPPHNFTTQRKDESIALVAPRRSKKRVEQPGRRTKSNELSKPLRTFTTQDGEESIALVTTCGNKQRAEQPRQLSGSKRTMAPTMVIVQETKECNAPVNLGSVAEHRFRVRRKSPDNNLRSSKNKPECHAKTMELPAPPWCAVHQSQLAIITYGEAADADVVVGQPATMEMCANGNDMPRVVRRRLRTKSPDCYLPLNYAPNQSANCKDARSLSPARRLRQRTKSPSHSFAEAQSQQYKKEDSQQDETNMTPVRRLRQRSKSPACRELCQKRGLSGGGFEKHQLWLEASSQQYKRENSQQDEANLMPVRCLRQCSNSPSCSSAEAQSQLHRKEDSHQDSLAVSLLRTPEWREICQKRGLSREGSKKHLAQQLRQAANSVGKGVGGFDELSPNTAKDSIGGQTANV